MKRQDKIRTEAAYIMEDYDLDRFLTPQKVSYSIALDEIRAGRKKSHWIWYIFPQLRGLGHSERSKFFGISCSDEARAYLAHPVLGARLIEITQALLNLGETDPSKVMGNIDDMKLRSCMTLFAHVSGDKNSIFHRVLEKFFHGEADPITLNMLAVWTK